MGAKKEFPCGTLIALVSVGVMLVSAFAGAVTASVDAPHSSLSNYSTSSSIKPTHVTAIHAEPSKTILAPNEQYVIAVDYYVSHGDDYYFKAWYYDEGTWIEIHSRHIKHTSAGWFSLTIADVQAPEKIGNHTVRVAGTQDYWSTPYDYNVAHDFVITVTTPLPDLAISRSDIDISYSDNNVDITATVHNDGSADANDVLIQFFAEDFLTGAITPIADNRIVSIPQGHVAVAFATWEPTTQYYRICVCADPEYEITETNENNNIACKSVGGPTIVDVKPNYENVFVSGIEVINRYNVFVDWEGGEPDKVIFELNGNPVEVPATSGSPSAYSEYGMGMDFYVWPAKNELKIIAVNKAGIASDPYILSPKIVPFAPWMLILLNPDDFSVTYTPPVVKYVAGFAFPQPGIDEKVSIPCWVPYIGGELGAKAGVDFDLCLKSSGAGSGKLTGSSKVYRDPEPCDEDIGFDIGGSAFGKANAVLDDIELESGELGLTLGGKVKQSLPIVEVLPQIGQIVKAAQKVPWVGEAVEWFANRAKIEGSIGPSISAKGIFEGAEPGSCMDGIDCHGEYDLALELLLALKAGMKNVEASVYGGGTPKVTLQSPDPGGDGWMGVEKTVVELLGGLKLKVWKFFAKLECVYDWPVEEDCQCKTDFGFKLLSNTDSTIWKVVTRDYANNDYSTFVGGGRRLLAVDTTSPTQEFPIIHNAYPYAQPVIASDGNVILSWVHDDVNKPNMQGEEIYYSLWNGFSWSQPSAITENYNLEFSPDIAFDTGGNAVAVWEHNKKIFYEENATLDGNFTSGFEIAYAVFNKTTLTWSTPVLLTNNDYMDHGPELVVDDERNVMVIWMVNENDTEMLYYSLWNGSTFSASELLKTNVSAITQSFAYKQGRLLHVWSQDADGNFSTAGDEELYSAVWNGTAWSTSIKITSDSCDDEYPSVLYEDGSATLLWLKLVDTGNMLYQSEFIDGMWTNQSLVGVNTSIIDFNVARDNDNNIVLVWEELGNHGPDMYYLVYDRTHRSWSDKNQLTSDIAMEKSITALFTNGTLVASYLKTDITLGNVTTNVTGRDVNITNVVVFGNTSLYVFNHNLFRDLAISDDDIALSTDNPLTGDTVTINATVHNSGDLSIDAVKVAFFDGFNGSQIGLTQIIDTIHAGANASVYVNWTVPLTEQSHDISVKVDPQNEVAERNESNNIASVCTVLPDLMVNWSFASYSTSDRQVSINTSIKNNGTISASNIMVNYYYSNYTDFNESALIKIGTEIIGSLPTGDSKEAGITWDVSVINRSWYALYVVVDPNNTVRESEESNNKDTALAKVLPDLTLNASDIEYSNVIEGTISITITVHNKGVYDAENISLSIYNERPSLNSSTILANRTIPLIKAHNSATIAYGWSALPGMYDIYVAIDAENLLDELDESNNLALNPVIITPGADLTLNASDITFSNSNPARGGFVTINATIHNNGDGDALGTIVQFFSGNPDVNGTLIGAQTITLIPAGGNGTACMEPVSEKYNQSWLLTTGLHDIYVQIDPYNNITETNETNNLAFNTITVTENTAPVFSNVSLSPLKGSWKDEYTYAVNLRDTEGDDVRITLQTFTNGNWTDAETILVNDTTSQKTITLKHRFTSVDRNQTAKYRFHYHDEVNENKYHSGELNTGYYPDTGGLSGPTLDNTSYGLGIVEGAGAAQGSSFYSWNGDLYTIVQPHDTVFVTASGSINNVGIYDYSDDQWYSYTLNTTYERGELANISEACNNHLNHFILIKVYQDTTARSYHMIKQTCSGGTVAGGYPGYGSSFTSWSTSAYTILLPGDTVYVAADAPVNKLGVFNYTNDEWDYYDLVTIVPGTTMDTSMTVLPKGEAIDVSSYLQPYQYRFVRIKVVQDTTERNFHIIKRTKEGGIVEGAQGDQGGSSFYSWSPSLYTIIQQDDHIYVTADGEFRYLKVIDKNTEKVYIKDISSHNKTEVVDLVAYLREYLPEYVNHLVEIHVYDASMVQKNIHLVKITPDGGIVEGGYASSHSSFGAWDSAIYTLFRPGERIQIAATGEFDTLKIITYTDDTMHTINLGNVHPNHTLVDVTDSLRDYEGHFIQLRVYDQISAKNFHAIKAYEKQYLAPNAAPELSDADVSPGSGSWRDDYTYTVKVSDADGDVVNVTLQVVTNERWANVETRSSSDSNSSTTLEWTYQPPCLARSQTTRYRFYYDDGRHTGYYPDMSGLPGPVLDNTSYGRGIVEGAGAGYGSSFYSWAGNLYTIVQPGDYLYVVAEDTINKVGIYDYGDDQWYYYPLNSTFARGELVNISSAGFDNHLNHFVRINVYFNDIARSFHLIKQTRDGGMIEGGYPGSGGSFTTWSTYAHTIIREGDRIYVAADAPVNKIRILNYTDDRWHEYDLVTIVPGHGMHSASTVLPKGEVIEVTSYLQPFVGRFVQIRMRQDSAEKKFHILKKTSEGGIVEGAEGGTGGSSFYSWHSSLYTAVQKGDGVYVSADGSYNRLRILDKTTENWDSINLSKSYKRGEVADVSSCFVNYTTNMLMIQVYSDTTQRNFHLVKISPDGGIVEGGYPNADASFNSWAANAYTLFRHGDRIIIAPSDYSDTVKVYDYTDDKWHTITLGGNVYTKYSLVDITPYLSEFEGHFIRLQAYYQSSQKNFHAIKAYEKRDVVENAAPVLANVSVSPESGSWMDNFTYAVKVRDDGAVSVTLQVFTNNRWLNTATKTATINTTLSWNYTFSCIDRNQTAQYRFYYDDGVNTGYYPSVLGVEGPALDNTSYGRGIVEGAGAGYGSSFNTWSSFSYTVVQPGDRVFVAASDSINRVGIYDYRDDQWYYYNLDDTYVRGERVNITSAGFSTHLNHFIQVRVYHDDELRNFRMIKQTREGGTVEGCYQSSRYGSSFSQWYTSAHTIIRHGDGIYAAADAPADTIGVYNYSDDTWYYYELTTIVPSEDAMNTSTTAPKGELINITSYLQPFIDRFVQVKILQADTERNFHLIKRTRAGGLIEGGDGDAAGGSSFYSWYPSLYTTVQSGDRVLIAANNEFDRLRIYDYTTGLWEYVNLSTSYTRGAVADVSACFRNYTDNVVQIQVHDGTTQRSFHLAKISPDGGIVEGGYPNGHSSFGTWAADMYTLFRHGDRIIVAPTGYIDRVRVYDYADDEWFTITLGGNVYAKYSLVDITPYLSAFEGHFIQLRVYYLDSQKSYRMIKAFEKREPAPDAVPVLSNETVSPESGSWRDTYAYGVNVSDDGAVRVTLQVFTNNRWLNIETKTAASVSATPLSWNYTFSCIDRNQTARYRFYYDDGVNTGYYPSEWGMEGPVLDDTSYGMGIVEGAGAGYGSSFYTWYSDLYTVVQPNDKVFIAPNDPMNNVRVYDYSAGQWYTYKLNEAHDKGREVNITEQMSNHLNNFVLIKAYHNDVAKSFHIVKQTPEGGTVEGGYPGYGSSFTSWSTYANTIILPEDRVYVAPEYDVNRIGIYNYSDDLWHYYTLNISAPAKQLLDISPYVRHYEKRFVQVNVLTDSTARKFHIIKRTKQGGIVEGAQGDQRGSSFYSWHSSLYTIVQEGDRIFAAADNPVNRTGIYDYTTGQWEYHHLKRTYGRGEVVDISALFENCTDRIVRIMIYQDASARNFHLVKVTPMGGIVEGGYPNTDASFNSWAADMYTLFSAGDRVVIAPADYIDRVKIYDYADDRWHTVNLGGNVFSAYSLVDITPYIDDFEGHFIRLRAFYLESQKSFRMIKVKQAVPSEQMPDLTVNATDIIFSNDNPRAGSNIAVRAVIHNKGDRDAANVIVHFFDGEPVNGTQIGEEIVYLINPGSTEDVSVLWNVSAGIHDIYVVIDPRNSVLERNETNNAAFTSIAVLPDLTLSKQDISFSALYRRPVIIQENSGNDLVDYQVNLSVDTARLILEGKMRADCGDIRFTYYNSSNNTEEDIPYWIASGGNSADTSIWIRVPYIPANGAAAVYMYYGDERASSVSNGTATFEFFDDFEEGYIDANKWNKSILGSGGSITVKNGYVRLHETTTNKGVNIFTKQQFDSQTTIIETSIRHVGSSHTDVDFGYGWSGVARVYIGSTSSSNEHPHRIRYPVVVEGTKYLNDEKNFHKAYFVGKSGNLMSFYWDELLTSNHTHSNVTGTIYFNIGSGHKEGVDIDYVRVRKNTSPEPTPAIGSEELVGNVTITATIHNLGGVNATNATVRFFDGDPDNGGTWIGSQTIDCIPTSEFYHDTDMDGDGEREILFNNRYNNGGGNDGHMYIMDGRTKAIEWSYAYGSGVDHWVQGVTVGDFDSDGIPELAHTRYDGVLYIRQFNPATGSYDVEWSSAVLGGTPCELASGDVDHDGNMEILMPYRDGDYIRVFQYDGAGSYMQEATMPMADNAPVIGVADTDSDGTLEVMSGEWNNNNSDILIYGWDGNSYAREWDSGELGDYVSGIVFGDVDNDGNHELVFGYSDNTAAQSYTGYFFVYQYDGQGGYRQEWKSSTLGHHITPADIGDWDNDGLVEIAVGSYRDTGKSKSRIWVYQYDGAGGYNQEWTVQLPTDYSSPASFADIDDDGTVELVIGGRDGYLRAFNSTSTAPEWISQDFGRCAGHWCADGIFITGEQDPRGPRLTPGGIKTASIQWSATPGVHDIYVVVDAEDAIAERSETNNAAHRVVSIANRSDLAIHASDITFSNSNPVEGEFVSITATVHNRGDAPAFNVPVRFYYVSKPDTDTVALWHFDEGSGNSAKDSSGKGNDGTIHGATWVDGNYGKALSFDGIDDSIKNTWNQTFHSEHTISLWFKSPGGGGGSTPRLFEFSDSSGSFTFSTALAYDPDGSLRAWTECETNGVRSGEIDYAGTLYNDNVGHHGVYTYNGTTGVLYIDGLVKQRATDDPCSNIGDGETFVIGNYYPGGDSFNGIIDEVRIYNRSLTGEEIKAEHGVIGTKTIPAIAAGGTATVQITPSNDNDLGWILANGTRDIYVEIDPYNAIPEQNETNNLAFNTLTVSDNNAPILSNATVSPSSGAWSDNYTYSLNISDVEGDNVSVSVQVFTNEHWIDLHTKHSNDTTTEQTLTWQYSFTGVDRNQTAKYRFNYTDYVRRDAYHSGVIHRGYYPSANGSLGPVLNTSSYGLGIVEGAGAGYGSSFYSWSTYLYTAALPGDNVFIAASEPVDNVQIYDYSSDHWYTYNLDRLYDAGTEINITSAFQNHLNHFVQVKAYSRENAKSFHMVKQTAAGGTVEGGYPGYGSSFTSWSKYANAVVKEGDSIYVAADAPFNRIGVYDYVDEYWKYHSLGSTMPKGVLVNINSVVHPYAGHIIQFKVLQDDTERNFHVIKRTKEGGIVEGAQGDHGGSSFYSWHSALYTPVQSGERVLVAANNQFNRIKVYDYTLGEWETIVLDRRYERSEVADITPYLQQYLNHLVQIQVFHHDTQRNFHIVKMSPEGGIVEGGYSSSDSSFGAWANNIYTLFRHGDRIVIAPTDDIDTIKIYDYADGQWHTISIGNVYPGYSLLDITPYIASHEGHFIRLQVYYHASQKSYHAIKAFEKQPCVTNAVPVVSNASVSPGYGSWKDTYTYRVQVRDDGAVNVTLQVFTNGHWRDTETRTASRNASLYWNYTFTCVDRNQTAKYRFYYDDGVNTGCYPSVLGSEGPVLDTTSYGMGLVEGAGAGYGSSFAEWSGDLYTIVQPHDHIYVSPSDSINRIGVYDYYYGQWFYYELNRSYNEGVCVNSTSVFSGHINHFVLVRVYYNEVPRSFHIIKQTSSGGTVEGGYASNGGSFSSWSTSAHTIIRPGDSVFVAADSPVNRLGVYDYVDEYWHYLDMDDSIPTGACVNITSYVEPYMNHLTQIKVLQDAAERNFHIIKKTAGGGIVESGNGGTSGSSFYSWYSLLYTAVQSGDRVFAAADGQYNRIKVYDYTTAQWETIALDRRYERSEVAEITPYLQHYLNHMIQLQVYHYDVQRNFHVVKMSPDGGIVEGGYPDIHSSFGSWAADMYSLFRHGDRIIIAPDDYIDRFSVYDYVDDEWHTINLSGNVYQRYSLIDITPYLSGLEGHFLRLRVYYQSSQKRFHLIKAYEKQPVELNHAPVLSNAALSPGSGSWKTGFTYGVNVTDDGSVDVTLQVFTNDRWRNTETKTACRSASLYWDYQFSCIDRNQTAKYRFYYDDGVNTGYYPSESGAYGPALDDTSYGRGIVEGAGAGAGSSFYEWSSDLYTAVQPGDKLFATASDSINKIAIYDYTDDQWYYHTLPKTYFRGEVADITATTSSHLNHFVLLKAYHNDRARNFHIIKQTSEGGTVEGGYAGSGGTFSSWSTYAHAIIRPGDSVFVAAESSVNRIGVYDYADEYWKYYNLSVIPSRGELKEITALLQPHTGTFIRISVLKDTTAKNFHIIKRTESGGIVEGGEGGAYGSSFYSWYPSLYTVVQSGDRVFAAADDQYNRIKVYDYTTAQWETIALDRRYERSEVAEVTHCLRNYRNHLIQMQVYHYEEQRNFHLVKMSPDGGIVEGGYPNADASFNSWAADAYTLFRHGDRIIIAPNDYSDTVKVYDYTDSQWHTISLHNVYPRYSLVDITPYLSDYEGQFIRLQVYYQTTQKNYHLIKASFVIPDKTPPDTTITAGPAGIIPYNDVSFTWNGSDDVTAPSDLVYSSYLQGYEGSWSAWTSNTSKRYDDLPDGSYIFKVKAKDRAHNEDATPAERAFTVAVAEADLIIRELWVCWPDNCTICYKVTNSGDGNASEGHNTSLYVGSVGVAHDPVPVSLAPHTSYIGCFKEYNWTYTSSDNITVCADGNNTIEESNESNNCLTTRWRCGDVNGDDAVDMSDVIDLLYYVRYPGHYTISEVWAADVNSDKQIDMSDVSDVLYYVGYPGQYKLNCCCMEA